MRVLRGRRALEFRLGVWVLGWSLMLVEGRAHSQDSDLFEAASQSPNRLYGSALVSSLTRLDPTFAAGQPADVTSLVFTAEGGFLQSCGSDGAIRAWNVREKFRKSLSDEFRTPKAPTACGPLSALAISPDGSQCAFGGGERVPGGPRRDYPVGLLSLRDQTASPDYLLGHEGPVLALAYRPHGDLLASGGTDGGIRLWSTTNRTLVRTLVGNGKAVTALRFTPDGGTVYASSVDGSIRVWDVDKGNQRSVLAASGHPLSALAMSPDGRLLASAGTDFTIRLWETLTGKQIVRFKTHDGWVRALAFAPDGDSLVSGGYDRTVRIRFLPTGHEDVIPVKGWVSSLAISPKGEWLAAGQTDGELLIWAMPAGAEGGAPTAALEDLWKSLVGEDPLPAMAAVWTWSRVARAGDPEKRSGALKFLKDRLAPVDKDAIEQLLRQLEDDDPLVRDKATRDLEKFGASVEPALRRALAETSSVELRTRVTDVLRRIATSVIRSPEVLRTARAIQILERAGGPESEGILAPMAAGAEGSRETMDARAALARLRKKNGK